MATTVCLRYIGRLNFPAMQRIWSPIREWRCAGVQIPQHWVADHLELSETEIHPRSVDSVRFFQLCKQIAKQHDNLLKCIF
jgi:hypothetical protein